MRNRSMAMVIRDKQILLVKEHIENREFFILPGGGIEEDESPEQAAIRELKEECGLDGVIERPLTINYLKNGSKEYVFLVKVNDFQKAIIGNDPEYSIDNQIIKDVCFVDFDNLSNRDKAFLWSYGLMEVSDFITRI